MTITVEQIINALAIIAGVIGSLSAIYAVFVKINDKRIRNEREAIMEPIEHSLSEIKQQNEDLKIQSDELKKEVILMMKLNQTMIRELSEKGHINGDTTQALQELQEYLINK